jgi:hypothetical protein
MVNRCRDLVRRRRRIGFISLEPGLVHRSLVSTDPADAVGELADLCSALKRLTVERVPSSERVSASTATTMDHAQPWTSGIARFPASHRITCHIIVLPISSMYSLAPTRHTWRV